LIFSPVSQPDIHMNPVQDVAEVITRKPRKKRFINPFPGLRPFGVDESHLFFGREGQSDDVLVKLATHRFVAVIGPSGSGKSSFMYCGVIPKLYGGFLAEKASEWKVIITRVGMDPIDNLATALMDIDEKFENSTPEDKKIQKIITSTLLQTQSSGLVERIAQYENHPRDCNYLLVVDQFEELFRYKQSDTSPGGTADKALAFVNLLTEAIADEHSNIYVALAMRSDFIGDCAQYPELTRYINESNYLIPQMTREQKRMAILGPVAVGGANVAPKLVQRLLNELGDNPDQLPVLAHALMRTWDYWEENRDIEEEPIDIRHYEGIGEMSQALSLHADEAYNELSETQKEICESMFKSLTGRGSNNAGVRRPTRVQEIAQIANCSPAEVIMVVEKFRAAGRALLTPPHTVPLDEDSVIDFSHESLMRIWVRLKSWVEEENESIQMYLRLAEAAEMYQVGKAGLWRPPDLQLATNWYLKEKPTLVWAQRYHPAFERTIAFLEHSAEKYETEQQVKEMLAKRALRRSQITAVVLGAAMIISLMFLVFAVFQQIEATAQTAIAVREKERAIQSEKEAKRQEKIAKDQKRLADFNAQVAKENENEAKRQTLIAQREKAEAFRQRGIAVVERQRAEVNEREAKRQEKIAKDQTREATKQKAIAEEKRNEAQREREKSENLRMLSIAKSMAVKSLRITDDLDKKAAVAQQAFNFNDQYKGNPDDPDIYDGLYEAVRDNNGGVAFNQLQGHEDAVIALAPSFKGNYIFSAGHDGILLRWNADDLKQKPTPIIKNAFINRGLAVSKDGKYLANAGETDFIQLFDLRNLSQKPKTVPVNTREVWFLAFTHNSEGLVYGDSTVIQYWNASNESRQIARMPVKNLCMTLSHTENQLVVGNAQGQLIQVDIESGRQTVIYENPKKTAFRSVAYSHDGKLLAAGDIQGIVRVWDVRNGMERPYVLTGHRAFVDNISFSPDDKQMATAGFDKKVFIWNTGRFTDQPIGLTDNKSWVHSVSFTADSRNILVGGRDLEFRFYPTHVSFMSGVLCDKLKRNLTKTEWEQFVAEDIFYRKTCPNVPEPK
jgi:WD40 repeat protein/energy-coupling factor transporter ATP-binding protein EcfA2